MQFFVGTSGFSYKEWKGGFYPDKLPAKQMLSYYASQFPAIEMNYTFRQVPTAKVLEGWQAQAPTPFRFALKAPMAITHLKRLKNAEEATEAFVAAGALLGEQRGPLLFQLPPNFRKDLPRLEAFLKIIAKKQQVVFEFRHESWFDDEVYACLSKHACALCVADTGEGPSAPWQATTKWGYIRLRSEGYTDRQLREWIQRCRAEEWVEAYVFFKHEDTGTGPKLAARFLELAAK